MPNHLFIDITGRTFGELTVVRRVENDKYGAARWLCLCICGKDHVAGSGPLRSGDIKSCGHPQTHCRRGHEFTVENTTTDKHGVRRCRACHLEAKRIWRVDNWIEKERPAAYASKVLSRYGITVEEYKQRLLSQEGICALCKKPLVNSPAPNLDHDHETGKLREFLHAECNTALGLLKDDPKICRLAAEYLERHKEKHNEFYIAGWPQERKQICRKAQGC